MLSNWLPRHRLTRHQYYLQLRKDILEDRLYCNEETGLFLVALALQAEFGDYMPEVPKKTTKQPQSKSFSVSLIGTFLFLFVFLCLFFSVVRQKLLPARALRIQEDAGETGPAHNKGGVAKTACKSRTDASRGGRNGVPQGVHISFALRNTSAQATLCALCLKLRNSIG